MRSCFPAGVYLNRMARSTRKIKNLSPLRRRHIFQRLQFGYLAQGDKRVTSLYRSLVSGVEPHLSRALLDRNDDDTQVSAYPAVIERETDESGLILDGYLLHLEVYISA